MIKNKTYRYYECQFSFLQVFADTSFQVLLNLQAQRVQKVLRHVFTSAAQWVNFTTFCTWADVMAASLHSDKFYMQYMLFRINWTGKVGAVGKKCIIMYHR